MCNEDEEKLREEMRQHCPHATAVFTSQHTVCRYNRPWTFADHFRAITDHCGWMLLVIKPSILCNLAIRLRMSFWHQHCAPPT